MDYCVSDIIVDTMNESVDKKIADIVKSI